MRQVYWDVAGTVWAEAKADKSSEVGKFFSWGPESCAGVPMCDGSNVVVPGVGCAQGSWGSKGKNPKTEGVQSALASVGSKEYADYMADAMTNTWTGNLGIDGYTEDCSCNYACMMQLTDPKKGSLPDCASIKSINLPLYLGLFYMTHICSPEKGPTLSSESVPRTRSWSCPGRVTARGPR